MGMVVRSNIKALNANRQLGMNSSQVSKSLEKLSSGYKINRAGDDASGLAISEKMKAQIKGLETASANSQDGISLVQTAEGALTEVHDMLNRMVELAGKAANGTIDSETDRQALQEEMDALLDEIDRIAQSTDFNGIQLLDGSLAGPALAFTMGTPGEDNHGGPGVPAQATFDFKDHEVKDLVGGLLRVGDKTYQFVRPGSSAEDGSYIPIELTEGMSAEKIANTVAIKISTSSPYPPYVTSEEAGVASGFYIGAISTGSVVTLSEGSVSTDGQTTEVQGADLSGVVSFENMGLPLQIGPTGDSYNQVKVSIPDMSTEGLHMDSLKGTGIMTQAQASITLDKIKNGASSAINTVSSVRAGLGAMQNRLEHTINNLDVAAENMESANSQIRDTDMAKEMMEYTKMNVLTQAAQAMLAQANQQPQSVLQLLQ